MNVLCASGASLLGIDPGMAWSPVESGAGDIRIPAKEVKVVDTSCILHMFSAI